MLVEFVRTVAHLRKEGYDYVFNIAVLGGSGVGVSSIVQRFCHDSFSLVSTDPLRASRVIYVEENDVHVCIEDLHLAEGVLLVFDLTDPHPYRTLRVVLKELEDKGRGDLCKLIVGNKSDLPFDREATKDLEKLMETRFVLTSAKTSANIDVAFALLASEIYARKLEAEALMEAEALVSPSHSHHKCGLM